MKFIRRLIVVVGSFLAGWVRLHDVVDSVVLAIIMKSADVIPS